LVVEWIREKLGSRKYNHDISARFFHVASCTRTFNCSAAQKYIGYSPVVSLEVSFVNCMVPYVFLACNCQIINVFLRNLSSFTQSLWPFCYPYNSRAYKLWDFSTFSTFVHLSVFYLVVQFIIYIYIFFI
jgi:hypothetical protein